MLASVLAHSHSTGRRARVYPPMAPPALVRGVVAEDEAAIGKDAGGVEPDSDSEAESEYSDSSEEGGEGAGEGDSEADRRAKQKAASASDDKVMVYDQHGDSLDKLTREAYMARTFLLHYESERVLPPKT